MKIILYLLLVVVCMSNAYGGLSCSAKGTDIYYVNGVLVGQGGLNNDNRNLGKVLIPMASLLDKKGKINVIGVHNPSYGILNDVAELFEQAYFIKTGKTNGKFYYNLANSLGNPLIKEISNVDPTKITKVAGLFGGSGAINFSTLITVAEESVSESLRKAVASGEELIEANQSITSVIGDKYKTSKADGKKVIFIAHSQGNAALLAGVKKLLVEDPSYDSYIRRYAGFMQVASPVPEINKITSFIDGNLNLAYKTRSIRYGSDSVINLAGLIQNSPVDPAPITHYVAVSSSTDSTGHYFSDTYLARNILIKKNQDGGVIFITPEEHFQENMRSIAQELEDNCNEPLINIASSELSLEGTNSNKYLVSGYAGRDRKVLIRAYDENDLEANKTTQFTWTFNKIFPYTDQDGNVRYHLQPTTTEPNGTELNEQMAVDIPINETNLILTITATNKYGKTSSRGFTLINKNNRAPIISNYSAQCLPDGYGQTSMYYNYSFDLDDDSTLERRVIGYNVFEERYGQEPRPLIYTDKQAVISNVLERKNPCPNYFKYSSVESFCHLTRPAIKITTSSLRGVSLYVEYPEGGTSLEFHLLDNDPILNTTTAFHMLSSYMRSPVTLKVKVLDRWSGIEYDAGSAVTPVCE